MAVDSIVCARIAWNTKTVFSVHFNELTRPGAFPGQAVSETIKDSLVIAELLKAMHKDVRKDAGRSCSLHDVDARTVLKIFRDNKNETIVFDRNGFYCYDGKVYVPNIEALVWLYQYTPLEYKTMELFSEAVMDSLVQTRK